MEIHQKCICQQGHVNSVPCDPMKEMQWSGLESLNLNSSDFLLFSTPLNNLKFGAEAYQVVEFERGMSEAGFLYISPNYLKKS